MRRRIPPAFLSAATGFVLLWHVGGSGAQPRLATGSDADVTEEGLHRVHPSIMEAAWVRPDLDLSVYTRILLMSTDDVGTHDGSAIRGRADGCRYGMDTN